MADAEKKVTEAKEAQTVPQEQYDNLYKQAVELEGRYRRLLEAYNALLDLYLSHK